MGGVGLAHRLSERQAGDEDGGSRHASGGPLVETAANEQVRDMTERSFYALCNVIIVCHRSVFFKVKQEQCNEKIIVFQ